MKICLSCFLAQADGGPYCSGCGRTFGSKLCESKHINPPSPRVQCCSQCGSTQLTEPARYLHWALLPQILTGLVALGLWRWAIMHPPLLGDLLEHFVLLIIAVLFGMTPCQLHGTFLRIVSWLAALWLFGWLLALLPRKGGSVGIWLRRLPSLVLKQIGSGAILLLRLSLKIFHQAVRAPSRRKSGDIREKP